MQARRRRLIQRNRQMYWMYLLAGGIFSSDEFSTCVKYFGFGLIFLVAPICGIGLGTIGYFLTVETSNLLDAAILTAALIAGVGMTALVPAITIYYRRDLKAMLYFMGLATKSKTRDKLAPPSKRSSFWLAFISCVGLIYLGTPSIGLLSNMSDLHNLTCRVEHCLFGIPYMDRVSTLSSYLGLIFAEIVLSVLAMIVMFSEPLLIVTIACELQHIVYEYRMRMQKLTDAVADRTYTSDELREFRVTFDAKLTPMIREYQVFVRSIQLISPYLRIFSALLLLAVFPFVSLQLFVFLLTDFNLILNLRLLAATILCQLYLYLHCKFGTMLDEMREDIVQQVYNLPWYYVTPERRKIVYIFLTQVQRPVTFVALRIFPITMASFPSVFRLAYSYVSVFTATLRDDP